MRFLNQSRRGMFVLADQAPPKIDQIQARLHKCLPQRQRANAYIHLVLGHVDTGDNTFVLCHHPLPSLLGSGSKPLQLFGLRKTPELSLALIQALSPLGATGSVPATGGWCATARWHTVTDFPDTRAQGRPGACCTRGLACEIGR